MKKALLLFLILCTMAAVPAVVNGIEIELNLESQDLAYTFFALSNGEATLVQSGRDGNLLINTGSSSSQLELEEQLAMYHIDSVDTVIITNGGSDYTGNLQWVIESYGVKKVVVSEIIKKRLISAHQLRGLEIVGLRKGDKLQFISALTAEVIYVEEREVDTKGALAIIFSFGKQTLLFMGVADKQVEKELIDHYPLKSTILKVADFGSEKGTTKAFLEKVDPQVAILFHKAGEKVSKHVLERLEEFWIDIYETEQLGTVLIKCHNGDYEILTVRTKEEDFFFSLSK